MSSNGDIRIANVGGNNWQSQFSGKSERLLEVEMLSITNSVTVGDKGTILKNHLMDNLKDYSIKEQVVFNPKPVKYFLTISNLRESNVIKVYDISGKLLSKNRVLNVNKYLLDFSNFTQGAYVVLIENESGIFANKISHIR